MSTHSYSKEINVDVLIWQIIQGGLTTFESIYRLNLDFDLTFSEDLNTTEISNLNTIVDDHDPSDVITSGGGDAEINTTPGETILDETSTHIFCDTTSGDQNIVLPNPSLMTGYSINITKTVRANTVTITTTAGTIQDDDNLIIQFKSSARVTSDGTNWRLT